MFSTLLFYLSCAIFGAIALLWVCRMIGILEKEGFLAMAGYLILFAVPILIASFLFAEAS